MMNYYNLCLEFFDHRGRTARSADHVSALYRFLINTSEVKTYIVSRLGRIHLCMMSFDTFDFTTDTRRHYDYLVISLNYTGLNSANWYGTNASYGIDVLYRDP